MKSGLRTLVMLAVTVVIAATSGCGPGMRMVGASPESLRARTLVVHVKSSQRVATLFHAIAAGYRSTGENEKADFFDAHAGEGFGSGFVVRSPHAPVGASGSALLFAVTNRHVVDLGDDPEIEIEGTGQRLPAEVIYTDPLYDLAVLFPKGGWSQTIEPMTISTVPVRDLDDVIATGYPALAGNPSYQSTLGSVSNANVPLGGVSFIQHSAPIDPGSSGGPLLNGVGSVVGVNAGKAPGRDNVYLAVPSKAVKAALEHAAEAAERRKLAGWEGPSLREACRSFASGITGDELPASAVYSIGDDLVAERGFDSLRVVDTDQRTTTRERNLLRAAFQREPVALLRLSVALRLFIEAHEIDGPAVACTTREEPNAEHVAKLSIQFRSRTRETVWRFEHGQWRLAAIGGMRSIGAPAPAVASSEEGPGPKLATPKLAKDGVRPSKDGKAEKAKPAGHGQRELPRP